MAQCLLNSMQEKCWRTTPLARRSLRLRALFETAYMVVVEDL